MKRINTYILLFSFVAIVSSAFLIGNRVDAGKNSDIEVYSRGGRNVLAAKGIGEFYSTEKQVSSVKRFSFQGSRTRVFTWSEEDENGAQTLHYAISLNGEKVDTTAQASTVMRLRYAEFDPLLSIPEVPARLAKRPASSDEKGAYLVQFHTQPLEEYREALGSLGAEIFNYAPDNAYIVQMSSASEAEVRSLPFVRWVGAYEPAYKLDENLSAGLSSSETKGGRYNIMVLRSGEAMKSGLASRIRSLGGRINANVPEGFRLEATLTPDQLVAVANESDVLFIDRWSPPESDMNIVRSTGGADYIESTIGFRGEGVRGEVLDGGLLFTHTDFQSGLAPIAHGASNVDSHGTATYGINFGRGTSNAAARGLLPQAQGIFADFDSLSNRYTHTAQLKQDPYKAVYQSNSWGNALTTSYTTISAEMDDILFREDVLVLNSQSNNGNQMSRPQAWAKNIVSVGGIRHFNTASLSDDRWAGSGTPASIGPAADGRMKPDLAHFYDSIHTTTSTNNTAYTTSFGGTSAATPITAGHFGLFFQMWHNGVFGNPTGATVFDSRPHMTTAKAVMINSAVQWDMTIAGTDVTRARQGFGRADVKNLYDLRSRMKIVNETDVLTDLQSKSYSLTVPSASTVPLKITMAYADPMGNPAATRARINDLNLKVTAPDGTIYWGNNGLNSGMWSTAGGSANVVDTVENVFIQSPAAGVWTVEVIAASLVQDARLETPGVVDADFALVASGIAPAAPTAAYVRVGGKVLTNDGRGIRRATVEMIGPSGELRTTVTGPGGEFYFDGVRAGDAVMVAVRSKRFVFSNASQVRTIFDDTDDIEFIADPSPE